MDRMLASSLKYTLGNVEFGQDEHPNGMPWSGILLVTDQVSDQAPTGADGHKILVPKEVAERQLHTLVNMGLNYRSSRDGHAVRNKVGVITKAWMEGNAVKVSGLVWKKDFPEAVQDLKGQRLGMSMELAKVLVDNPRSPVWKLNDFVFTGATALWPKSAAYHRTALAASKDKKGGNIVEKKKAKKAAVDAGDVQILASAIGTQVATSVGAAFKEAFTPVVKMLTDNNDILLQLAAGGEEDEEEDQDVETGAASALRKIVASASGKPIAFDEADEGEEGIEASGDDDVDEEDEDVHAEGKDSSDDDESDDEDDEDEDDDGDGGDKKNMKSESNVEAGKVPPQFKKFMKSGSQPPWLKKKMKGGSSKVVNAMAAAGEQIVTQRKEIKTLRASVTRMEKTMKSQKGIIKKMEAQQDKFAEHITRRTLPPEAAALMAKAGIDPGELYAEGRKLSVVQVDQILAEGAPGLGTKERMALKNVFLQHNLMDAGIVDRGYQISS